MFPFRAGGIWEILAYTRAATDPRPAADPAALMAAVDLVASAKPPVLITGGGTILSRAGSAVGDLCERFGIPILTTPTGRGSVAETHPLFCGLTGLYRTTFPRRVYEAADLMITVGSRMEEFQGRFLPYPDNAKLIQVDIHPFELGRNWEPDVAIQADARQAVDALARTLQERGVTANEGYVAEITSGRRDAIAAATADAEGALEQGDMPLKGKSIVYEINRVFGDNTILVKENGGQDLWCSLSADERTKERKKSQMQAASRG